MYIYICVCMHLYECQESFSKRVCRNVKKRLTVVLIYFHSLIIEYVMNLNKSNKHYGEL